MIRSALVVGLLVVVGLGVGTARAQALPDCEFGIDVFGNCRDAPPATSTPGVVITSVPSGAEISEDGKRLGFTPMRFTTRQLTPGRHQLVLSRFAYVDAAVTITVDPRRLVRRDVALIAKPVMKILNGDDDTAGATVLADDVAVGTVPVEFPLEPGFHSIRVVKPNFQTWQYSHDFLGGVPPDIHEVKLKPEYGTLVVGTGAADQITGAAVFLDPDPGKTPAERGGLPLGTTPTDGAWVRSGKHVIELRYDDLESETRLIEVPIGGKLVVSVGPPAFDPYPDAPPDGEVDFAKAKQECQHHGVGNACVVAAYAETDPGAALELYRLACKNNDAFSCYAAGYLATKQGEADGGELLGRACRASQTEACWARHVAIAGLPDPTRNPGDWTVYPVATHDGGGDEEPAPRIQGHVHALAGVGPDPTTPIVAEVGLRAEIDLAWWTRVSLGLTVRGRAVDPEDASTRASSWTGHGGLGIEAGLRLRPSWWSRFGWLIAARGTAYFPGDDGFSAISTLSFRRGKHLFELGALLDRLPVRYQDVDVFDGHRVYDPGWRVIPVVRYSRITADDRF